ncbi:hypothetical protein ACLB2K_053317 [Fragaria x ananassa]
MARLVGETIIPVLQVDERGINNGLVRVRLTLRLHDPVHLERRIRVSPEDVITVKFWYELLLGRCRDCAMINHGGLPCASLQEPPSPVASPAIQLTAPPMMVFRGNTHVSLSIPQREREKEDDDGSKRARHSLVMVPMPLNPNELGFSVVVDGILSIVRTGKSPKKRGRPCGSKNKKPNLIENLDSMAPSPAVEEKADAPESEED